MNRRVLGSLGAGTRTMQPHMISNTATSMMPSDPFLTPPHHATPRESQRDLLIREYGKLKSRLNLTKAEYQLHRNNIGYHSTDVNEEDDHSDLVVGVFETPPKTPKESNEKRKCQTSGGQDTPTSSKPKAKKQRVQRTVQPVSISTQICGLTKEQLINVVTSLSDNHPELEEEIRVLIPSPDISVMETRLNTLHHNIFKSFPYTRFGSSRDAFCYRRVKTHLVAFKKDCIDQCKTLMTSESWQAVIEYVLMAWKLVNNLPSWDNPAHNASKLQCFKSLATQCKQALKKSCFEKELYNELKQRLEEAAELDDSMDSCVEEINKILRKL